MDDIEKLHNVTQFNSQRGQETLHPLVSVLDQSRSSPIKRYPQGGKKIRSALDIMQSIQREVSAKNLSKEEVQELIRESMT